MNRQDGFTLIELMIVVSIIGFLAAIVIPNYIAYRNKAFICEGMVLFQDAKENIVDFYNHCGFFPKDNLQAGLPAPENMKGKYVERVTVVDGAVNVKFYDDSHVAKSFNGTTMTFLPAVPVDNPVGIIVWESGGSYYKPIDGFKTFGKDQTDIKL